jgi:hypothetical protein
MNNDLEFEGQKAAPYPIYRLGLDQYGKEAAVDRVKECWTEQEVLDFKPRLDARYVAYVRRKQIPLCEFKAGKR